MILNLINKLPKPIRVFLKEGPFYHMLNRKLASEMSREIVALEAEKMKMGHPNNRFQIDIEEYREIENKIAYKREALRHLQFESEPTHFEKSVMYPLLEKGIIFIFGLLIGNSHHFQVFWSWLKGIIPL